MQRHIRATSIAIASALITIAPHTSAAQMAAATQTDSRWLAWLGCWAPDSDQSGTGNVTCIVPVKGARAVDAVTIVRGKVSTRDRLDGSGRPHIIDGQGCRGTELVSWSATGRRVYLHADYTCGAGTPGTSATIFAMSPAGEWLRVEQVRSGGGTIASVTHLRPTSPPDVLGADAVSAIQRQQRASITARAAAAAPITTDEVIDAVHRLDADVVRSWVVASEQTFNADASQIDALVRAGVPAPVVEAVTAANPAYQNAVAEMQSRGSDAYPNAQTLTEAARQPMRTLRVCPPDGCSVNRYSTYNGYDYGYGSAPVVVYPYASLPFYSSTPVIVRHNGSRGFDRGFGRGIDHGIGRGLDHGIGRGLDHGIGRGIQHGPPRGGSRYHPPARPTPPKTAIVAGRRR